MEENYSRHGSRKKTRIFNRPISSWEDEHQDEFQRLIEAVKEQITLATADPDKRLCLFTDASEPHWSGVLTQVTQREFKSGKAPQNREHFPVGLGTFRGSSIRWTMPEKETYAIVASVVRL